MVADSRETVEAKKIEEIQKEDIFVVLVTAFGSDGIGNVRWKKSDILRESEIKAVNPDIELDKLIEGGTIRKANLEEIGTRFAVETKITIR